MIRTERFNRLLAETRGGPQAEIVNEVVLRTQMQAIYSPENIGHFGLNLQRYAHFTSPIRRYADLIVHRALIAALKLGDDGLSQRDIVRIKETAEMITAAERRAMAAERDATDRYIAAYLSSGWGRNSRAGSPASPGSACSCDWTRPARTAWSRLGPGRRILHPRRPRPRPGRRAHRPPLPPGRAGAGAGCARPRP